MPADYTNLPAHIATRVAVAADGVLKARATGDIGSEINALAALSHALSHALREAREAERVTVADNDKDARRYAFLRDMLHGAVGGRVEVNDERLVYETPEPGREVRIAWYPDTPVGFYEAFGATLDEAIDAMMEGQ